MKKQKINPALATSQAPRSLRVGSKGHARAVAAAHASEAAPDEQDDDDEDADPDDEKSNQEAHDATATNAAAGYRAAADAAEATMGSDSASMLQAGEAAHDAAMEAGSAFKSSCVAMRGAAEEEGPPSSRRPGAAPGPTAQAIARAAATPTAAAHLEVAQFAALGRDVLARTGAKNADAALLKLEAGLTALAEVTKLRAADVGVKAAADLAARRTVLEDAVAQDVIKGRAKAFHIDDKGNVGAPLPVWMRGTVAEVTETLVTLGYKPGAPAKASSTLIIASADGGGEAGLVARAQASGMTIDQRREAEARIAASIAAEEKRR